MLTDFYSFFLLYSWIPSVFYIFGIRDSYIVFQLPYAIMSVSRIIYAFYSLFLGLSLAHTLISVTFDSIIYALYSLSGLSLAHILICVTFVSIIYALYSLLGLSLAHILYYLILYRICIFYSPYGSASNTYFDTFIFLS